MTSILTWVTYSIYLLFFLLYFFSFFNPNPFFVSLCEQKQDPESEIQIDKKEAEILV